MDLVKLEPILKDQPRYRKDQIDKFIYKDLSDNWKSATALPLELRTNLGRLVSLEISATLLESEGGTIKALITLSDGLKIESVLMRYEDGRNTVCVSSQVGCPLGCAFCATGAMGFKRNLKVDEIVEQVLLFSRFLKKYDQKVSNAVFMGMGEPFLNYENVILAIRTLNDPKKLNLGARRISVSTAGIPEFIRKYAADLPECNLAISLHAATQALRSKLMPINNAYSLSKVMEAVDYYIALTSRKVMLEYILIEGVNDTQQDTHDLAALAADRLVHVNLIPYNPTGVFKSPSRESLENFRTTLKSLGISVTQRFRFGTDISAACGQLIVRRSEGKSQ